MYRVNIDASILLVPLGAPLNSLQIKTPQNAATIVPACPTPKVIA